jgi:hypothetical protein
MIDIRTAMTDPNLFGPVFSGPSFAAWRALLAGFYALPLDDSEAEIWRTLTGRAELPTGSHNELWVVAGRRAGKSHVAALMALHEALFVDRRDKLAPGEVATVMVIAGDRRQARTTMRYVSGLVNANPMPRRMVVRENSEAIEFDNRTAIEIPTASFRAVRGYTLSAAICDEIAFWHDEGASPDTEIVAAIRPALATLNGKLIAISSPHARRGALWDQFRRHYAKNSPVLVAQAPSRVLNPELPQSVVDAAMADDPARASAEYLAQFRSDIEQLISADVVLGAERQGPLELPRRKGNQYFAFVDPAGGGADEFTIAIAHDEKGIVVVDVVRGRRGNPAHIVADYAELCRDYGIRRVFGDRYAGEWPRQEFRKHGIAFHGAPGTRLELYLSLLAALNSGRVELPPCQALERQLVGLERRITRGGRDIVDHAPGASNDRANAAAGVVALLATEKASEFETFTSTVVGLW